jgi:hypothetical protein
MRGAIPPLPNMPSWRGAQFKKTQGQLYLYLFIWVLSSVSYTKRRTYIEGVLEQGAEENILTRGRKCRSLEKTA